MNDRLKQVAGRLSMLLLVVVLAASFGFVYGLGLDTTLLILAGGVLISVIGLFWRSLLNLTSEAPMTLEEALSLSAPSAEEERKQAVLRALKDLDYERSVGKLSEEDYLELSTRYRADAKALLMAVDRDLAPAMKKAEDLLSERLGRNVVCGKCEAQNDPDAQFCKRCGAGLSEVAT